MEVKNFISLLLGFHDMLRDIFFFFVGFKKIAGIIPQKKPLPFLSLEFYHVDVQHRILKTKYMRKHSTDIFTATGYVFCAYKLLYTDISQTAVRLFDLRLKVH